MANIKITSLKPTGYELFSDSESYMSDVESHELEHIKGGKTKMPTWTWTSVVPGSGLVVVTVWATMGYPDAE